MDITAHLVMLLTNRTSPQNQLLLFQYQPLLYLILVKDVLHFSYLHSSSVGYAMIRIYLQQTLLAQMLHVDHAIDSLETYRLMVLPLLYLAFVLVYAINGRTVPQRLH